MSIFLLAFYINSTKRAKEVTVREKVKQNVRKTGIGVLRLSTEKKKN